MCFLDATRNISTNRSWFSEMASTSSILLSRSAENPSQSAFFRLKRLLNVVGCATITGFTLTDWAMLCVVIGSRTHIFEMFDDANMRSGLSSI